jgi:hypothetical protein
MTRRSKEHSRPGDSPEREQLGHGKKAPERGELTNWRQPTGEAFRTQKGSTRGALTLLIRQREGAVRTRKRQRDGHLHSRDGTRVGRMKLIRTWKEGDRARAHTLWRPQREGLVRTRKETDRARYTHQLVHEEGGTSQDTERNRPREWHLLSKDSRGNLSGHAGKKLAE